MEQLTPSHARSASETTSAFSSRWLADRPGPEHGPLRGEIAADVVVVGGGIAGVTTALRLQREGVRVVLLEDVAIGSGVSGLGPPAEKGRAAIPDSDTSRVPTQGFARIDQAAERHPR